MSEWKFFVEEKPWTMERRLHIIRREGDNLRPTISRVTSINMESSPDGSWPREQSAMTDQGGVMYHGGDIEGFLRAAMDAAWEMGLRPKGFEDHTSELKATRYHLEDMRLLAKTRVDPQK